MARAAGIRVGDVITRINDVYTDDMTLFEAQMLLLRCGRRVQIFVYGDAEADEEPYTYLWFIPRPKRFPPIKVVSVSAKFPFRFKLVFSYSNLISKTHRKTNGPEDFHGTPATSRFTS